MRIAIIGSREIKAKNIDRYIPKYITLLISGGAEGIDTLAERYADKNNIPKLIFKPDYKKYGKSAPHVRNRLIADNSDTIIAIWNGVSLGTKYTIDYAKSIGKQVRLVLIDVTGTEIFPGNSGRNCPGNGEYFGENDSKIGCRCDECDFLQCCVEEQSKKCYECHAEYCPRKFNS